jgi:hypothetical protein
MQESFSNKKKDSGLPFEIKRTDVVKLLKDAWNVGLSRVYTNKKVVLQGRSATKLQRRPGEP